MAKIRQSEIESIKRRFGIIGTHEALHRAIEVAYHVAPTDLSVLVQGESGAGKEFFPKIIHQYSARKHGQYIAVNCGAIPEGTIDSELFGHVKGSFTGAVESRAGYFEVADGGTIFLDEVAELPLATQARLLRVLESREFIRVGSSSVQKSDIRVIAATNVRLNQAIAEGKFREDLYYRLSTVPIYVPPLRERGNDCLMLFMHFANEFAERYRMPPVRLTLDAQKTLLDYSWPGNVRQLKNITEQLSIIESSREISSECLIRYLYPQGQQSSLPALYQPPKESQKTERELLYSVLYEMRNDMNELKQLVLELMQAHPVANDPTILARHSRVLGSLGVTHPSPQEHSPAPPIHELHPIVEHEPQEVENEEVTETAQSLSAVEEQMIRESLARNNGHRRQTAEQLGISERTLYRKIKEYNIDL